RYTHFGEGKYDESEAAIQELLTEAGSLTTEKVVENPTYQTYAQTRETYLGYARMESLASPEKVLQDVTTLYTTPAIMPRDQFALAGTWQITPEYAAASVGAKLQLNFSSKSVFLVARPKTAGTAKIQVHVDGKPQFFGADVVEGTVQVTSDRLYSVVELSEPGRHTLELTFPEGEIELYAFTFG
ncbi:MAG: hypothetical protein COU68_02190, partial [Candidatus Pacebacteria bacterium CG10_big_fil_rev_8_21_14_0_10_45_6]